MGTKKGRKRTVVVDADGTWRFQTGMVTAALIARGVPKDEAYAGSARLRDELRSVERISANLLQERIDALVEEFGYASEPPEVAPPVSRYRNRLLRFAVTAGLSPGDALSLSQEVEARLTDADADEGLGPVEDLVTEVLRERFGRRPALRFALTTSIRRSERPVVVLIGGATGSGKSTLATELAFRLGISHVTSTDMVREAMRSVLSREVVPGLHDHSFRGIALGREALSDPRERVLAGYRQQAEQVAVGVRALVRRAARENKPLVIEGVHLRPPFHRYVPADVRAVAAGLLLAVPSERAHRKRFPARAKEAPARGLDDYLDSFQAVRWIQEDLLAEADVHNAVVVANRSLDSALTQTIDVLTSTLDFGAPVSAARKEGRLEPNTLFLIVDGLPDSPNPALGDKTPLAAAATPVLDLLAAEGGQGLIQTGVVGGPPPETDEGLMALLGGRGARPARLGRGLLEALGLGMTMPRDAIVLRGNLATVSPSGELLDRRAGRIREGTSDLLATLQDVPLAGGVRGSIRPAHEHRVVVMLQGPGLSAAVTDTDPGSMALDQRPLEPIPIESGADRTAAALKELLRVATQHLERHPLNRERQARGLLPANCVITRGACTTRLLPDPPLSPTAAAMVAGCSTARGVARALGLQPVQSSGMTANLDTDLDAKFEAAASLLEGRGLVVVHLKGGDIAAHDRRPLEKRDYIARVDAALGRMLRGHKAISEGLRVVLSADHGTDSRTGDHLPDPVPVLVARWSAELDEAGERADFDEESARGGALGLLQPGDLHELLWGGEA